MRILEVHNVAELVSAIEALLPQDRWPRYWYRGHRDSSWKLLPTGRRGYDEEDERGFYNEFYARASVRHPNCPPRGDHARWLSLMQHYGLPTRLLDWSKSPLIAAYFATAGNGAGPATADACIWVLEPGRLNESMPGFSGYLYSLDDKSLEDLLWPAKARPSDQTAERLPRVTIAAMAIESDVRMQVQQSAFTVHGVATPLEDMTGSSDWLAKLTIPADSCQSLARELTLLGFYHGDLFPDLDNLSQELKNRYPPR